MTKNQRIIRIVVLFVMLIALVVFTVSAINDDEGVPSAPGPPINSKIDKTNEDNGV